MNPILVLDLILLFMGICGTIFTILRIKEASQKREREVRLAYY
jgi:hypothetical protein